MSKHLNLPLSFLTGDRYLGSDPVTRSTCISLHVYCVGQENGGRVVGARLWRDRKCQQVLGVTREELDADSDLWDWEGDDILLRDYNHNQERLAQVARENGKKKKRGSRTQSDSHRVTHPKTPPESQPEPSGLPDGQTKVKEGKVKEGKETNSTTASGDAGEAIFYETKKERKLTGKRLEAFEKFWDAYNYRKGKAEAADAWLDIPKLTDSLVLEICRAARLTAKERRTLVLQGRTPIYPQGWISGRRWEDSQQATEPEKSAAEPVPEPYRWRVALKKYFEQEGMEGALKRLKSGEYKSWLDVHADDRAEVLKISEALREEAA